MIDWVTAVLPCLHVPLNGGNLTLSSGDGEIEWTKERSLRAVGSYEAGFQVRSVGGDGQGRATHLHIHGNPSKFLQGHNLFGSDDLLSLVGDTYDRLVMFFGLSPTDEDRRAVEQGAYTLSRIDYAQMYELPTRGDVRAWLRAAEYKSKTRHGRPTSKGGTLYWGQHSRRWALKGYCKGDEIEAPQHRLPRELQIEPMLSWVDNKLRIELTLRTKELIELGLRVASVITPERLNSVFEEYVRRLDMTEQIALTSEQLFHLPQKLRSTYILWNAGEDLRQTLPKATYYRHRKELLGLGINIDIRKDVADRSNVIPLLRVLEARPASVPNFAFEMALVHHSASRSKAA